MPVRMINILIALTAGAAVFAAIYLPGLLNLGESIAPGVLVAMVAYFLLVRRTFKQLEKIFMAATKAAQTQPPRLEKAVTILESAYTLAKVQIGVRSQVDAQIGSIYFIQKEFKKAEPYLSRSSGFSHWIPTAMLAVVHYKRKDHEAMRKTLEIVTKRGKKQGLAWNLRAYLLCQIGERDAAQRVLVEGVKKTGDDAKVREALLQLQNGKKIKMRGYKEQWYQFHLEQPPARYTQQQMPMRVGKIARRGRW